MTTFLTLFRRTAAALGAIAALTVTSDAGAQTTITLSSGTDSCIFSTMTVLPNGSIDVNCDGGTTPPPAGAGTFTLIANLSSISTSSTTTSAFQVKRTLGSAGAVWIDYEVEGPACTASAATHQLVFASGSSTAQNIPVVAAATPGDCTVRISLNALSPAAGTIASTGTEKTIPVMAQVAGCPTNDAKVISIPGNGIPLPYPGLVTAPGVITAIKLPVNTRNSGIFKLSDSNNTPSQLQIGPYLAEISINKCKGVMDDSVPGCWDARAAKLLTRAWMKAPTAKVATQTAANVQNACIVPNSNTIQYYINVRYTYQLLGICATGKCGWVPQWTEHTLN